MIEDKGTIMVCPVCGKNEIEYWIKLYGKCFHCNHKEKEQKWNKHEEEEAVRNGETEYCDDIICPYCGYRETEYCEPTVGMNDGDDRELMCYECEKTFIVCLHVSFSYSTKKIDRKGR